MMTIMMMMMMMMITFRCVDVRQGVHPVNSEDVQRVRVTSAVMVKNMNGSPISKVKMQSVCIWH